MASKGARPKGAGTVGLPGGMGMGSVQEQLNALELQKRTVLGMLELDYATQTSGFSGAAAAGVAGASGGGMGSQFKILVYDASGLKIVAPLLNRGALMKNHGVINFVNINSPAAGSKQAQRAIQVQQQISAQQGSSAQDAAGGGGGGAGGVPQSDIPLPAREPVPEMPVIYFVAPTMENVVRIVHDLYCAKLYTRAHVNFTSAASDEVLQALATGLHSGKFPQAAREALGREAEASAGGLSPSGRGASFVMQGAAVNTFPGTSCTEVVQELLGEVESAGATNAHAKGNNHGNQNAQLFPYATRCIQKVVDRYASFVTLTTTNLSLNLHRCYSLVHNRGSTDAVLQALIDRMVEGLVCMTTTLFLNAGYDLPVVRCVKGQMGEMVAKALCRRLRSLPHELVSGQGGTLRSSQGPLGTSAAAGRGAVAQGRPRPLLVLFDRDIDLHTLLGHTWTYAAMCHDVLHMQNGGKIKVSGEEASVTGGTKQTSKEFNIDVSDSFWQEYLHTEIPETFPAIANEVQAYEQKTKEHHGGAAGAAGVAGQTAALQDVISNMPEIQEKKKSLDMHTNIATTLLATIKRRGLDELFTTEEGFGRQTAGAALSAAEKLCQLGSGPSSAPDASGAAGAAEAAAEAAAAPAPEDKARLLLVLYLLKSQSLSQDHYGAIEQLLSHCHLPTLPALSYLKSMVERRQLGEALETGAGPGDVGHEAVLQGANSLLNQAASVDPTGLGQQGLGLLNTATNTAAGQFLGGLVGRGLQQTLQGIKTVGAAISGTQQQLRVVALTEKLMENAHLANMEMGSTTAHQHGGQAGQGNAAQNSALQRLADNYVYMDPKAAEGQETAMPKVRKPFRRGLVFMVGGGNYVESRALRDSAKQHDREILYAATNFVSPHEFLQELQVLGSGR